MNESVLQNALRLRRVGKFAEAAQLYVEVLRRDPKHFEALHALGVLHYQSGRLEEAVDCFDRALMLKPDYIEALGNRGGALLMLGRTAEAVANAERLVAMRPDLPQAWASRAGALLAANCPAEALLSFDLALSLKNDFAQVWKDRATALVALNRESEALGSLDKAVQLEPKNAEFSYRRADLLLWLKRYSEAAQAYESFLALQPHHSEAWSRRGVALTGLRRQADAFASFDKAVALDPVNVDALNNRANVHFENKRFEEAARDYERVLQLAPDLEYVEGFLIQCRIRICDWGKLDADRRRLTAGLAAGKRMIDPQGNLSISRSPEDQLQCARIFMADEAAGPPLWRGERYSHDRVRLAYLSADFRPHPVAFLVAGVFEHHDKSRFETIGISFGPGADSDIHARIAAGFEHFHDVRNKSDAEVAAMLKRMEIDIAVDLMAFTDDCRPAILAQRPAPIQVNFLGFPGTMGAAHIDYMFADRILIPADQRRFYSEQVVYLPDTYQANDSKRRVAESTPSRSEAGLPETGFVFCCFNNNHKIAPEIFDIWMRLLSKVEGSVLWLLADNASAAANLRREAAVRGVAPERLIYAPRTTPPEHLARQRLADLFLDTSPYGAHTTCSDALWVGLPVVTYLGPTFAARVAGSLLTAAGLPELVTASPADYEALALDLARDAQALAGVKTKLARNRGTCPLFDTARFTRNLENAFTTMMEHHRTGLTPQSFAVEPPP